MRKMTVFEIGEEDYRRGGRRVSYWPERAAGYDAAQRAHLNSRPPYKPEVFELGRALFAQQEG